MSLGTIGAGIGQAGSRALRTYMTLKGQYDARKAATEDRALQLAMMLANADEETRPALSQMFSRFAPNINLQGLQFPSRPKAIGQRKAREVLAGKPDLLAKLPVELHEEPWDYVLQIRPELGKALYGVQEEPTAKAQAILDRHADMEKRYGRKQPFSPEERAALQAAGYVIPMRKEPVQEARPAPTGVDPRGMPLGVDPRTGRLAERQIVTTGEREVEDLPTGQDEWIVEIPGMGRRKFSDLPAGAQTEIIKRAYESSDRVEITLTDGQTLTVPRDKAVDYVLKLDQEDRLRGWSIRLNDGTMLKGLTAGEFVSMYNAGQNREVTLRGQDITVRGQNISAAGKVPTYEEALGEYNQAYAEYQTARRLAVQLYGEDQWMIDSGAAAAARKLAAATQRLKAAQQQPAAPVQPVPPRPGEAQQGAAGMPARPNDYLGQVQAAIFQAEGGTRAKTPYGYMATTNPQAYGAQPWAARGQYDEAVRGELATEYRRWASSPEREQGWDFIRWLARKGYNANPKEWDNWERNVRAALEGGGSAGAQLPPPAPLPKPKTPAKPAGKVGGGRSRAGAEAAAPAPQSVRVGGIFKQPSASASRHRDDIVSLAQSGASWPQVEAGLKQLGVIDKGQLQWAFRLWRQHARQVLSQGPR